MSSCCLSRACPRVAWRACPGAVAPSCRVTRGVCRACGASASLCLPGQAQSAKSACDFAIAYGNRGRARRTSRSDLPWIVDTVRLRAPRAALRPNRNTTRKNQTANENRPWRIWVHAPWLHASRRHVHAHTVFHYATPTVHTRRRVYRPPNTVMVRRGDPSSTVQAARAVARMPCPGLYVHSPSIRCFILGVHHFTRTRELDRLTEAPSSNSTHAAAPRRCSG